METQAMIKKINRTISRLTHKDNKGQVALIMILLAAAALIFLSIAINWGRIAQIKAMVSIAADQAASMLASDAASYGEMEKQSSLQDTNQISALSGVLMDIILIVIAVVVLIITITSAGGGSVLWAVVGIVAAAASLVMACITLALELTTVQPGLCALWNKLQADQPQQQQFYEQGISTALGGVVTDQVNITDYLDLNTNGLFGFAPNSNTQNDIVGRFAFFYTERLKMLNSAVGVIHQAKFFYNQLSEFMNGDTCAQNYADINSPLSSSANLTGVPLNPTCIDPSTGNDYCVPDLSGGASTDSACGMRIPQLVTCAQNVYEHSLSYLNVALNPVCSVCSSNPADPSCQSKVSNVYSFQLNDQASPNSNASDSSYTPYSDPCCQPLVYMGKGLRPTTCPPYTTGYPTGCFSRPGGKTCTLTPACKVNPAHPDDPSCYPTPPPASSGECVTNNPYGSSYEYLYDSAYQGYSNGVSFLDQYGRDQQMVGAALQAVVPSAAPTVPPTSMTSLGDFPNGIYPLFWLMSEYSPEVDNITPSGPQPLKAPNYQVNWSHWCAPGGTVPSFTTPSATAFPDLIQLGQAPYILPYACSGGDCCVNYLLDSLSSAGVPGTSNVFQVTVGDVPTVTLTITSPPPPASVTIGVNNSLTLSGTAAETGTGGSIASISLTNTDPTGTISSLPPQYVSFNPNTFPSSPITFNVNIPIPVPSPNNPDCSPSGGDVLSGKYTFTATVTDIQQPTANTAMASASIQITNPYVCGPADNCGNDGCVSCGPACPMGSNCNLDTNIPGNAIGGPGTCACATTCTGFNCGQSCGTLCGTGNCLAGSCSNGSGASGPPGTCS